jgi:hypothetical protein
VVVGASLVVEPARYVGKPFRVLRLLVKEPGEEEEFVHPALAC